MVVVIVVIVVINGTLDNQSLRFGGELDSIGIFYVVQVSQVVRSEV